MVNYLHDSVDRNVSCVLHKSGLTEEWQEEYHLNFATGHARDTANMWKKVLRSDEVKTELACGSGTITLNLLAMCKTLFKEKKQY